MFITDHACERYLERVLHKDTWSEFDIKQAKNEVVFIVNSRKHKTLFKDNQVMKVLIDKLIIVFNKTKKVLLTLYPATEEKIITYMKLKYIELNKNRFKRFRHKKHYIKPEYLSISISDKKSLAFLTVNGISKSFNISGCFASIEKAQKFIDDYIKFYSFIHG